MFLLEEQLPGMLARRGSYRCRLKLKEVMITGVGSNVKILYGLFAGDIDAGLGSFDGG